MNLSLPLYLLEVTCSNVGSHLELANKQMVPALFSIKLILAEQTWVEVLNGMGVYIQLDSAM